MSYVYQTFTAFQVLTAAQVQSLMDGVRDHVHGTDSVSSTGHSFAGLTSTSTLVLSGTAANIQTGANFISYGGTDAGLSFSSGNNATFSNQLTVTGGVTLAGDPAADSTITIGGAPSGRNAGRLKFIVSNATDFNWQLSSNGVVTAGAFEITPSTAAGGSTFTTPVFTLTTSTMTYTGNMNLRTAISANTTHSFCAGPNGDWACYLQMVSSNSNLNWQISTNGVTTAGGLEFTPSTAGGGSTFTTPAFTIKNGVMVGAPTGGLKGNGTANFAADIYKNDTAYTNPDYVLEHWATGRIEQFADKEGAKDYAGLMPLEAVEVFARNNLHLPRFGQKAGHGLFGGSDALLASVEESYLHLFDHESRIKRLERAIAGSSRTIQ